MDIQTRELLEETYQKIRKITIALGLWLLGYAVVEEGIRLLASPFHGLADLSPLAFRLIRYAFFGAVLLDGILLPFIRRAFLGRAEETRLSNPQAAIPTLFNTDMLTLGFVEVPALLGFVLFLLSGNWLDFYGFLLVSLVYLRLYIPRLDRWERWITDGII